MSKYLFYQLNDLARYSSNLKIKFHKPKEENLVFKMNEHKEESSKHANYVSILQKSPTEILMYYNSNSKVPYKAKTIYSISQDGINFTKKGVLHKKACFSNNMNTFIDQNPNVSPDEKYKAIGGLHLSLWYMKTLLKKKDKEIARNIEKASFMNLKPLLNLKNPEDVYDIPHPAFISYKKADAKGRSKDPDTTSMFYYLDPKVKDHTFYGNGISMFVSGDGLDWKPKSDLPIIHGMHPGHYDKLYFCSHFDCHPCCFYDTFKKQYIIYLRSNVDYGVRHVQFSLSKDLNNWTPLKFVNFDPIFNVKNDNYYSMNAMIYPGTKEPLYIAFPPYYQDKTKNSKKCFISLAMSRDGINWKICDRMITPQLIHKEKISSFPGHGIVLSQDQREFYLYEHKYRSEIIPDKDPQLYRYSIRRDGFVSLESNDDKEASFETKTLKFRQGISFNFKTDSNDGYLEYNIIPNDPHHNKKINDKIKGDHLDYTVLTEQFDGLEGIIQIKLYKARFYAFSII